MFLFIYLFIYSLINSLIYAIIPDRESRLLIEDSEIRITNRAWSVPIKNILETNNPEKVRKIRKIIMWSE